MWEGGVDVGGRVSCWGFVRYDLRLVCCKALSEAVLT